MRNQQYPRIPPPSSKLHNIPSKIHPPSSNIPNQTPTFFGSMIQGMALGTGSSIGNKMVDSIFTGKKTETKNENNCNDLDKYIIDFNKCMMMNDNNYQECYSLLDIYMNCKKLSKSQEKG